MCLIGFIMSYIVYVKTMIPQLLLMHGDDWPEWVGNTDQGHLFWGTLFSFGVLFPLSIPTSLNALQWSSLFGVLCSVYLVLAVTLQFFCSREIVPDPMENWQEA